MVWIPNTVSAPVGSGPVSITHIHPGWSLYGAAHNVVHLKHAGTHSTISCFFQHFTFDHVSVTTQHFTYHVSDFRVHNCLSPNTGFTIALQPNTSRKWFQAHNWLSPNTGFTIAYHNPTLHVSDFRVHMVFHRFGLQLTQTGTLEFNIILSHRRDDPPVHRQDDHLNSNHILWCRLTSKTFTSK